MIQAVTAVSEMRGRSERWATRPSRDEVAAIASQANDIRAVPIFREVMADLETPVSAFLKIRGSGPAFLLESIEGGERLARYSFIGADPIAVLTMRTGLATLLTATLSQASQEQVAPVRAARR
jgi:anthranilate synthase component 1